MEKRICHILGKWYLRNQAHILTILNYKNIYFYNIFIYKGILQRQK